MARIKGFCVCSCLLFIKIEQEVKGTSFVKEEYPKECEVTINLPYPRIINESRYDKEEEDGEWIIVELPTK